MDSTLSPSFPTFVLPINRHFPLKVILVFLIFAMFAFSNKSNAVVVVIEGGSSFVCPKGTYTYTAKTYHETLGYEITSCEYNMECLPG